MKNISLRDLLEAGCHFGHSLQRWHPKAASFIYEGRDGVHIIDLAKTKAGLENAGEFVKNLASEGKKLLLVATKRQAKGVVTESAKRGEMFYLTNRWIGGFITNWEEVKKNIDKIKKLRKEKDDGSWDKFPKHEVVKILKDLRKLETVYGGVVELNTPPDAVFIVDIKKEISCLRESLRRSIPTVAIVDTNTDPTPVDYPIPANDDAVGSIQYIVNYIVDAYLEGRNLREKQEGTVKEEAPKLQRLKEEKKVEEKDTKTQRSEEKKVEPKEKVIKVEKVKKVVKVEEEIKKKASMTQRAKASKKEAGEKPKKKGRPRKKITQ